MHGQRIARQSRNDPRFKRSLCVPVEVSYLAFKSDSVDFGFFILSSLAEMLILHFDATNKCHRSHWPTIFCHHRKPFTNWGISIVIYPSSQLGTSRSKNHRDRRTHARTHTQPQQSSQSHISSSLLFSLSLSAAGGRRTPLLLH